MGNGQPDSRRRAHFLNVAANVMRRLLIDHVRVRNAEKRGAGQVAYIDDFDPPALERPAAIMSVEDALQALEKINPHRAKLVEMRFFGGMTAEESGRVPGVSRGRGAS